MKIASLSQMKRTNYFIVIFFLFCVKLILLASDEIFLAYCDNGSTVLHIMNEDQTTVIMTLIVAT